MLTGTVANRPDIQQMGDRTAIPQYRFPQMRIVCQDAAPIVRASWMRGVSALPNVFAHESWIDELAYIAQQDPIAFRLRYLDDPRALALIEALKNRPTGRTAALTATRRRRRRNGSRAGVLPMPVISTASSPASAPPGPRGSAT